MAELRGGLQGVSKDGKVWVRTEGGGFRGQVLRMTAGHMWRKIRGTVGAGFQMVSGRLDRAS